METKVVTKKSVFGQGINPHCGTSRLSGHQGISPAAGRRGPMFGAHGRLDGKKGYHTTAAHGHPGWWPLSGVPSP